MTDGRKVTDMRTASETVQQAAGWSRRLEELEARRNDLPLEDARPIAARKVGVAPGTFERLRNGRLKAIAVHVWERLQAAIYRELQAEMRQLEHELQIIRQSGVDPRGAEVAEVVEALAKARRALGLGRGPE